MTENNDIKTALCLFFVSSGKVSEDIADREITGLISYFDYAAAKAELVSGGFLIKQNGNIKITDKGIKWAETFVGSLDNTLRETFIKEAKRIKSEIETAKICRTKIEGVSFKADVEISDALGEQYYVTAEIGEETLPVMNLRLYTPDKKNAEKIDAAIKRDPFGVYKKIMNVIEKTEV
jgi:hypothetical protein